MVKWVVVERSRREVRSYFGMVRCGVEGSSQVSVRRRRYGCREVSRSWSAACLILELLGRALIWRKVSLGGSRRLVQEEVSSGVFISVVAGASVGDLPPTAPGGNPRWVRRARLTIDLGPRLRAREVEKGGGRTSPERGAAWVEVRDEERSGEEEAVPARP